MKFYKIEKLFNSKIIKKHTVFEVVYCACIKNVIAAPGGILSPQFINVSVLCYYLSTFIYLFPHMLFCFSSQLIFFLPHNWGVTLIHHFLIKMSLLGLLSLGFLFLGSYVYASNDGWIDAHATFYGGGDASGTMGEKWTFFIIKI